MALWPLTFEIITTFLICTYLLYRYSNWNTQNIITTVSVFIAWFFSFIVIFILPLDVSNTAYQRCLVKENVTSPSSTTMSPIATPTSPSDILTTLPVSNVTNSSVITMTPFINDSFANLVHFTNNTIITNNVCIKPWSFAPFNVMTTLWKIVYWTAQLLTWIVLPLMQSYCMAGDFSWLGKLRSSLIENAIYYGSFAILFIIILIYVASKIPLSWHSLKVICTTASNTWGLFLLIVLLGYGLVQIPRSCLMTSYYNRTTSYYYFRVAKLSAEKCEADEKLEDTLEEIQHAYETIINTRSDLKPYIEIILSKCPDDWRQTLINRFSSPENPRINRLTTTCNEKSLVRIHKQINRVVQTHRRTHFQYEHLIKQTIDWEDVARNENNIIKLFKPTLQRKASDEFDLIDWFRSYLYTPTVEWYWKCSIRAKLYRYLSYLLFPISLIIFWSELTMFLKNPPSLFILVFNLLSESHKYFLIEIMSIMSIAYLSICTYYSVFKMRLFNYYYLAPHHQTDEYSLIFCGMLLCRLTPALCLNFLSLIHFDSQKTDEPETAFSHIMGHLNNESLINFGLTNYLPLIMCLFCLATFFDFGSKLLHMMGIEQFIVDDEMTGDLIREGQELVKRERTKRQRFSEMESNRERYTQQHHQQLPESELVADSRADISFKVQEKRDNSRLELLNDAEPMDYSTWSTTTPAAMQSTGAMKSGKPVKGIFDDI